MSYWIVDEIKRKEDGKIVKIFDGPFADSQRDMVLKEANKSDKYFQRKDPSHIKSYVIKADGKYSNKLRNKQIIYPENYLKRTGKNSKSRLADKIKLPKIKNSWLVKRSRGKC